MHCEGQQATVAQKWGLTAGWGVRPHSSCGSSTERRPAPAPGSRASPLCKARELLNAARTPTLASAPSCLPLRPCRLKAYRKWLTMAEPAWSDNRYPPIDYQGISYYSAPKVAEKKKSLDEVRQRGTATAAPSLQWQGADEASRSAAAGGHAASRHGLQLSGSAPRPPHPSAGAGGL